MDLDALIVCGGSSVEFLHAYVMLMKCKELKN